jgi:tellurite resistance protein TerC
MGWEKFPPEWSLGITFAILGLGIAFSLWKTKGKANDSDAVRTAA